LGSRQHSGLQLLTKISFKKNNSKSIAPMNRLKF
jgi:hypothetical protein